MTETTLSLIFPSSANPTSPLLQPMLAMVLLTACVWLFMYVRRLAHMVSQGIDAQRVNTPQKMAALMPESVEAPSNNLKNLFELPVLFYALCLLMVQQGWVVPLDVGTAWAFVGLRAVHSAVHCTVNIVAWRFAAYVLSSLALWFMLGRVLLRAWG